MGVSSPGDYAASQFLPIPRHDRDKTLRALAHVIGQTPSWLLIGDTGALPLKEQRVRNAAADGAVNVLAGFLRMNGASAAFPDPSMKDEIDHHVDILATIKGGIYRISVITAQLVEGEQWLFAAPFAAISERIKVIGVVPVSDLVCDFIYFDHEELLERGKRSKTGTLDVITDAQYQADGFVWPRIESFRDGSVG